MFDLFDSNGGGTIDAEELDLALKSVDIHLSQEDLQEVVGAMDKDGKKLFPNAIKMIILCCLINSVSFHMDPYCGQHHIIEPT